MEVIFQNVSKSYSLVNALKDIDFKINSGEFVFLVGPSGAGKSTLLKLILGQIRPTAGSILLNSTDLSHSKKHQIDQIRRKIGVIFQDYQLLMDKSVEENIALALDIVSYPKEKIAYQLDEVIKKVNLSNRRLLFPSQLSGGELQRTALARALAIEPNLILADEPTGNLDAENSWNLIKLLNDINQKYGTTIIMTSHNQDFIESMGKKVIHLQNGEVKKIVDPLS
jgi:cell division transport system ATP-binding protein